MRYFVIVMLLVLLLGGCMSPKYYTSKGVSYFQQPVKELDNCFKFTNPITTEQATVSVPIAGNPVSANEKIYFPVETSYLVDKQMHAYTTVYAVDAVTNAVTDSLVLKDRGIKETYRHVVFNNDIYLVGTRDSLLYIYKTDGSLDIINQYSLNINLLYIAYAAMYDGRLRIVGTEPNKDIVMYELKTDTMQPERKRLLLKNFDAYDADGNNLWYFSAGDTTLSTARIDISAYDPNPVYKSFNISIPEMSGYRAYHAKAAGEKLYISYSWFTDDAKGASKLISINYADGKILSKEVVGNISFDVITANGKTYIFRTAMLKKKQAFTVAELTPELAEVNPAATFFMADYESVKSIVPYKDNKFFLTGMYQQKTGKKIEEEIPGMPKMKMDEMIPQPFFAIIDLQ